MRWSTSLCIPQRRKFLVQQFTAISAKLLGQRYCVKKLHQCNAFIYTACQFLLQDELLPHTLFDCFLQAMLEDRLILIVCPYCLCIIFTIWELELRKRKKLIEM